MTGLVVHALSGGVADLVASQTARYALYFFIIALSILILCLSEGWLLENVSLTADLSFSIVVRTDSRLRLVLLFPFRVLND